MEVIEIEDYKVRIYRGNNGKVEFAAVNKNDVWDDFHVCVVDGIVKKISAFSTYMFSSMDEFEEFKNKVDKRYAVIKKLPF